MKILYHNHVINEFIKFMDIIPENPPIYLPPAMLDYALITVNDESLIVKNGDVIRINRSDIVSVRHVETNYKRGITCSVLGFGNLNDIGKGFIITDSTKIVFRKEAEKFAEIFIQVDRPVINFGVGNIVEVTARSLNIRSMPSLNARVIGGLSKGQRVIIQEESPNWARITLPGVRNGWINKQYLIKAE